MDLDHVGVFVSDLDRSRIFYEETLGLALAAKSEDDAFRIWTFRRGGLEVHLFEPKKTGAPRIDHVAIKATRAELDQRIEDLRRRGIAFTGPHVFEGTVFIKVMDPDGAMWEWNAPE